MKVAVIGGGPGGLYLAILLRRADPRTDVTVWERNRIEDTFGFGVVLSDATEGILAEADAETHETMAAATSTSIPSASASRRGATASAASPGRRCSKSSATAPGSWAPTSGSAPRRRRSRSC